MKLLLPLFVATSLLVVPTTVSASDLKGLVPPEFLGDDVMPMPPFMKGSEQFYPEVIAIIGAFNFTLLANIAASQKLSESPLVDLVFYTGFLHGRVMTPEQYAQAQALYLKLILQEQTERLTHNLELVDALIEGYEHHQQKLTHPTRAVRDGLISFGINHETSDAFKKGHTETAGETVNYDYEQEIYTNITRTTGALSLELAMLAYLRGLLVQHDQITAASTRTQTAALESLHTLSAKPTTTVTFESPARARLKAKAAKQRDFKTSASGSGVGHTTPKTPQKKLTHAQKKALRLAEDAEIDSVMAMIEGRAAPAPTPPPPTVQQSPSSSTTVSTAHASSDDEPSPTHRSDRRDVNPSPTQSVSAESHAGAGIDSHAEEIATAEGRAFGIDQFHKHVVQYLSRKPLCNFFYELCRSRLHAFRNIEKDHRTFYTAAIKGFEEIYAHHIATPAPSQAFIFANEESAYAAGEHAGREVFLNLITLHPLKSHRGGNSFAFYHFTLTQIITREIYAALAARTANRHAYYQGFYAGIETANKAAQRESLELFARTLKMP